MHLKRFVTTDKQKLLSYFDYMTVRKKTQKTLIFNILNIGQLKKVDFLYLVKIGN